MPRRNPLRVPGSARRYIDPETGQEISRRQYDKKYGRLAGKFTSYEQQAKYNKLHNPIVAQARPARGRKAQKILASPDDLYRLLTDPAIFKRQHGRRQTAIGLIRAGESPETYSRVPYLAVFDHDDELQYWVLAVAMAGEYWLKRKPQYARQLNALVTFFYVNAKDPDALKASSPVPTVIAKDIDVAFEIGYEQLMLNPTSPDNTIKLLLVRIWMLDK